MRDENKITVPKEIALRVMDWHGGQFTSLYAVGSSGFAGRPVDPELLSEAVDELETIPESPGELIEALRELLLAFEEQREPDEDVIASALIDDDYDDEDEDDEDEDDFEEDDYDEDEEDEDTIQMNPPGDGESIDLSEIGPDEAAMARDRRNKTRR